MVCWVVLEHPELVFIFLVAGTDEDLVAVSFETTFMITMPYCAVLIVYQIINRMKVYVENFKQSHSLATHLNLNGCALAATSSGMRGIKVEKINGRCKGFNSQKVPGLPSFYRLTMYSAYNKLQ